MSELTTLARPYAKAAFEFAQSNDQLQNWSDMLSFCAAVVTNEALAEFLDNPGLTRAEASSAMLKVVDGNVDEKGANFIKLLAQNKRLELLPAIAELFEENKALYEKSIDVEITSAADLSEDQVSKLTSRLSEKLGRQVNINSQTDASLIGGMLIRAGDTVIDATLRGKLNELSDALLVK